ncbi:glycosyltransferase family 2 protein [Roseovarius sp. EL26]|uniref:glycosyltransferase family 2 protein n=1 Tax=Roseovarius sp. EL26 TaxID=2126672 RepID=UPI001C1F2B0C|nr:glycosyltransferase family 2 protein [Roseovarius sp. EL26]
MSILVFIPMYNCSAQIPRVLHQLRHPDVAALIDGVVCIDNQSTDDTAEMAGGILADLNLGLRVLLSNDDNYGLGGSHKVAINFARKEGFTHLIVLHGDDQGSILDIVDSLKNEQHLCNAFLMGARFMPGSRLEGYSPLRTIANRTFNWIFSLISRKRLYDLGSGLNLFQVSAFDDDFHIKFADDLTFNYYLILALTARKLSVKFFPLTWREDDQVSNAKLGKMGMQIIRILTLRLISRRKFLHGEHRQIARATYSSTEIGRWRL